MASLNDSIKSPFIRIYNFENRLLATSNFNHIGVESPGIDVVSLKYIYDDENDDECIIRLQASDVQWIEYMGIDIEDIITLTWGYINGPETSKRTVVVRDIRSNYGANVLYTELICTDMATYLKTTNSPFTAKINPINYIKEFCSGTLNINIISAGKVLYRQDAFEKTGQYRNEVKITEFTPEDDTIIPNKRSRPDRWLRDVTIYEEEVPVGNWSVGPSNIVRKFMEKERDLNVANKSPYTVISELMQLCPQGPWFVSGRDNNLLIHNRDLGGGSYRIYAYKQEPGYLITFQPETKYEAFSKNTISQTGMDPANKSVVALDSYISILDKLRNSKDIITDRGKTDKQKAKELTEWLSVYKGAYQKYLTLRRGFRVTAGGNYFYTKTFDDKYYEDKSVAKQDATDLANPIVRGKKNPNTYIDPLTTILFGYEYVTPLTDVGEVSVIAENATRKLQMEKEEGKAIIEGDPSLQNNLIVTIDNVQHQHIGNYYIKKCDHTISNMGYKVNLDMFKILDEAILDTYVTDKTYKSETKIINGEEREEAVISGEEKYNKEERIFRKWNILPVITIGKWGFQADDFHDPIYNPPTLGKQQIEKNVSLDEYLNNNPDTNAQDLINLYKRGKLKFAESNTESR